MLKHPAWAAAISSSGLLPFLPSNRVPKLNAPLKTPLCPLNVPFPSLSLPSHVATALLVDIVPVLDEGEVKLNGESGETWLRSLRLETRVFGANADADKETSQAQVHSQGPPAAPAPTGNAATPQADAVVHRQRFAAQHRLLSRRARLRHRGGVA